MTIFGYLELFSIVAILSSIFLKKRRRYLLLSGGLLIFLGLLGVHFYLTSPDVKEYRLFSIPESPAPRSSFFSRLIDERDVVYVGTQIYGALIGAKPFGDVFEKQYASLATEIQWPLATPLLSSLLESQSRQQNWTMQFSFSTSKLAKPAIYLHGAMGSYVIQCWLVASVLRAGGYTTICPSLSFTGLWGNDLGVTVLSRTLDYAKEKYPGEKVLFVGLSNGATALTHHRNWLAKSAAGFILISGGEAIQFEDKLPTLLVWGTQDQNIPFDNALDIKSKNQSVTLLGAQSDHSAFVREHEYFNTEIRSWLSDLNVLK